MESASQLDPSLRWDREGRRTCPLLPTAYCLLPTAYCLLPTAYCLLPPTPHSTRNAKSTLAVIVLLFVPAITGAATTGGGGA